MSYAMTQEEIEQGMQEVAGWPYRLEMVAVDTMYVDRKYQRDLKPIEEPFNPLLVQTLTISERPKRDKMFSIIDGQRRWNKIVSDATWLDEAPSVVFSELDMEQEAWMFALFQLMRKGITPYERFKAELAAKHVTAMAIDKIVREEGFKLANADPDMRHLKAVRTVERIYKDGPEVLRQSLRLIRLTWDGVPHSSRERQLRGVSLFVMDTPDLDEQKFITRLGAVSPSRLEDRATKLRESKELSGTSPKFIAEVIDLIYRKR